MPGPNKWQLIAFVRWLAVVPAAQLTASWALSLGYSFSPPANRYRVVVPLLQLLPAGIAFTFVGGIVAPRFRVVIAILLASYWIPVSLNRHIFGQTEKTLFKNLHATGECLGAVIGIAIVGYLVTRQMGQARR